MLCDPQIAEFHLMLAKYERQANKMHNCGKLTAGERDEGVEQARRDLLEKFDVCKLGAYIMPAQSTAGVALG
jgi:hypothetical protein